MLLAGEGFESNQGGIETPMTFHIVSTARKFESNQGGIETMKLIKKN